MFYNEGKGFFPKWLTIEGTDHGARDVTRQWPKVAALLSQELADRGSVDCVTREPFTNDGERICQE